MTFGIITTTSGGIVLATDSRQSYRNRKGISRIGSDNASKLFQLSSRIGVAVAGLAFIVEDGVPKNISKFIEEFKRDNEVEKLDVKDTAEKLHAHFDKKYRWNEQLDKLQENIKVDLQNKGCEVINIEKEKFRIKYRFKNPQGNIKEHFAGVEMISFIVGGYNNDGTHQVFTCYIPGEMQINRDSTKKNKEYGTDWIGQLDVVQRIVLGYDGRISNVKFYQEATQKYGEEELRKQLTRLEYSINYGTLTLQDTIDFSTLIIRTTSAIQRFSDGILADPGDIPGVGGAVDVAVITPDRGFVWISKKNLIFGESEIDLDKEPKLKMEVEASGSQKP